jgi:hypothetical protein
VQVLVSFVLLKLAKPQSMVLLRGNHESDGCAFHYGFWAEVGYKYKTGKSRIIQACLGVPLLTRL